MRSVIKVWLSDILPLTLILVIGSTFFKFLIDLGHDTFDINWTDILINFIFLNVIAIILKRND